MVSAAPDNEQVTAPGAPHDGAPGAEAFPSPHTFKLLVAVILGYFGLRLCYLAGTISPLIPPDETTHFGISRVFSHYLLLPVNTPDSYQYGLVTNIPWLYYWIMGKLLPLNFLGISDLVFLRLCNIPLALGFVYFVWRTLKLLTADRLTQLLLLVALTNTMMLTFISAVVSYDNLLDLLAAMSVYYLLAFFKERQPHQLPLSLLCQLGGCLTKITFLPLVLVLGVILVLHEARNLPRLPVTLAAYFRRFPVRGALLALSLLLGLAFNLQLHLGNYLKYHILMPGPVEVLPLEDALQFRLAARGYIVNGYRMGRLSKEEALKLTEKINHPGDRADAVAMMENYDRFKAGGSHPLSLPAYIPVWTTRMAAGIFGIFGHIQMAAVWPLTAPIWLLAWTTLAAVLIRWRPRDLEGLPTQLLVISVFYASFLLYKHNYQSYVDSGSLYAALHGRYLFPVIGPIYVVSSLYLMRLFPARGARLALWGAAVAIFLICDFPLFLARVTPEWGYWPS